MVWWRCLQSWGWDYHRLGPQVRYWLLVSLISGNDDDENDDLGENSTTGSPPTQARPDISWDVSLSPVREAPGTIKTFCLVRFSCLSPITWKREVDVVKVWQDLELTSIGVFLPCEEDEEKLKIAFKSFAALTWTRWGS